MLPWAGGIPGIGSLLTGATAATGTTGTAGATGTGAAADLPALFRAAMGQAWRDGDPPGRPARERAAQQAVAALLGEQAQEAIGLLSSPRPVDPDLAARLTRAVAVSADPDPLAASRWMPFIVAVVLAQGQQMRASPAVPGTGVGRLVRCRPHERPPGGHAEAVLLIDRPVPALAPLLFSARGVISRAGAAGSHLAEVARSIGVPMVAGCRPESAGQDQQNGSDGWLAAVDGSTGQVALLPA